MGAVSRVQSTVQVLRDGTPVLISNGKQPTLWREQGGQWNALYKGQKKRIANGDQISVDCYNPEGAVFTCQDDSAQAGGGQQMQGGYGQQMQGGYDQQQGGYGQAQQGYAQQQGGYGQQSYR